MAIGDAILQSGHGTSRALIMQPTACMQLVAGGSVPFRSVTYSLGGRRSWKWRLCLQYLPHSWIEVSTVTRPVFRGFPDKCGDGVLYGVIDSVDINKIARGRDIQWIGLFSSTRFNAAALVSSGTPVVLQFELSHTLGFN